MLRRSCPLLPVLLLLTLAAVAPVAAKDKKKLILPYDILQARTVLVLIDPDAGLSPTDPNANRNARDSVEKAIMKWGRFNLVQETNTADLVIIVRKGHGKMVEPTIGTGRANDHSIILEPTEDGVRLGGRTPNGPNGTDPGGVGSQSPSPRAEVSNGEDSFLVYRGVTEHPDTDNPLDSPPVWRLIAKDALATPGVPAVDEFRKAINEAEKQASKKGP